MYVKPVDAYDFVSSLEDNSVRLCLTDPPYNGIIKDKWDNQWETPEDFSKWLSTLFTNILPKLTDDGSLVFFGSLGAHGNHPIFDIVKTLESRGYFWRDWITWRKRRAYGRSDAYLYIREEVLWFSKSPDTWVFNKPYTDILRGYEPYDPNYPTHSPYKRVGNVIDDINELFRPERVCQKPLPLMRRFVETHSNAGDLVVDPFVGWGSTGVAAVECGRKFLGSETIPEDAEKANERITNVNRGDVLALF